jgi:ABC-type transport system involved in cytochrome c biogenesis ATPase subunit
VTATSLIGWDAEVRALTELIGHAVDGGQCLVVLGDPGIGKTSLLRCDRRPSCHMAASRRC